VAPDGMAPLPPLPWDTTVIERLLPHRDPFLLVDRIDELEADLRIVGVRTWTRAEAGVMDPDGRPAVAATRLTECMAQVGALLVLAKPENAGRLIYFLKIDKARFRAPVRPGETTRIEADVISLRRRIGTLHGRASVDGRDVAGGTMTFALSDAEAERT